MKFNVVVRCPFHKKDVVIVVEAPDVVKAKEKIYGTRIACPWGPRETVEKVVPCYFFAEDIPFVEPWRPYEEVVGARHIGPKKELGVLTSFIEIPGIEPIAPRPAESVYYMSKQLADVVTGKLEWWKDYREEAKKLREKWRKEFLDAVKEFEEKKRLAKLEYERQLAEAEAIREKAEREKRKREIVTWREMKLKELEDGLKLVWKKAVAPQVISVIDEETAKEFEEISKRLKIRFW